MRTSPLAVKSLVSSCCTSAVSLGIVLTSLPHHPLGYSPPLPSASALQAEPEAQRSRSRSQGCAGSRGSRPSPLRPIVVTGLGSPPCMRGQLPGADVSRSRCRRAPVAAQMCAGPVKMRRWSLALMGLSAWALPCVRRRPSAAQAERQAQRTSTDHVSGPACVHLVAEHESPAA